VSDCGGLFSSTEGECVWDTDLEKCFSEGSCYDKSSQSKCDKSKKCQWMEYYEYCEECGPCGCISDAEECVSNTKCLWEKTWMWDYETDTSYEQDMCSECWGSSCLKTKRDCEAEDYFWNPDDEICLEQIHQCWDLSWKKGCNSDDNWGTQDWGCLWRDGYCDTCDSGGCECMPSEDKCGSHDSGQCVWDAEGEECHDTPSNCWDHWESSCATADGCAYDKDSEVCYNCDGCDCAKNSDECSSLDECNYDEATSTCYASDGNCWNMPSSGACEAADGCQWKRTMSEEWDYDTQTWAFVPVEECNECNGCDCGVDADTCASSEDSYYDGCLWTTELHWNPMMGKDEDTEVCRGCYGCGCANTETTCAEEDYYGEPCQWLASETKCVSANVQCWEMEVQESCTSNPKCAWQVPEADMEMTGHCYECKGCYCGNDEDSCQTRSDNLEQWGDEIEGCSWGETAEVWKNGRVVGREFECTHCYGCSCHNDGDSCTSDDTCSWEDDMDLCISADSGCWDRTTEKSCGKKSECKWQEEDCKNCESYCYDCGMGCDCRTDAEACSRDNSEGGEQCAWIQREEYNKRGRPTGEYTEVCESCYGCECGTDESTCETAGDQCSWTGTDCMDDNAPCWERYGRDSCDAGESCRFVSYHDDHSSSFDAAEMDTTSEDGHCEECYGCNCASDSFSCSLLDSCKFSEEHQSCDDCYGCDCATSPSWCASSGDTCMWDEDDQACADENRQCYERYNERTCQKGAKDGCQWEDYGNGDGYCITCDPEDCYCQTEATCGGKCNWNSWWDDMEQREIGQCEECHGCACVRDFDECDRDKWCEWVPELDTCYDKPDECYDRHYGRDFCGQGKNCMWNSMFGQCNECDAKRDPCGCLSPDECWEDDGCQVSWNGDVCEEYVVPMVDCMEFWNGRDCEQNDHCLWSKKWDSCEHRECDDYSKKKDCPEEHGCVWDKKDGSCGEMDECGWYESSKQCDRDPGCEWEGKKKSGSCSRKLSKKEKKKLEKAEKKSKAKKSKAKKSKSKKSKAKKEKSLL